MGYFSNGTEGLDYQERYCERCVHFRDLQDGRGPGCPIWDAHLLYAYDETGTESNAEAILDLLIHRGEIKAEDSPDGIAIPINEECTMFLPRDAGAAIEGQLRIGDA